MDLNKYNPNSTQPLFEGTHLFIVTDKETLQCCRCEKEVEKPEDMLMLIQALSHGILCYDCDDWGVELGDENDMYVGALRPGIGWRTGIHKKRAI